MLCLLSILRLGEVLCAHNARRTCAYNSPEPALPLPPPPPVGHNGQMDTATPPAGPPVYKYQTGKAIEKIRYTHDAMVDLIVANPRITQGELAAQFGYTQAWVSLVMSSDAFRERLAARREELVDPAIRASLEERFRAVVTRSLEVLQEKLSAPVSAVPDNLALRAAELGAKALGLGGNAPAPQVVVQTDHLQNLAQRLVALQSQIRQGVTYEQV